MASNYGHLGATTGVCQCPDINRGYGWSWAYSERKDASPNLGQVDRGPPRQLDCLRGSHETLAGESDAGVNIQEVELPCVELVGAAERPYPAPVAWLGIMQTVVCVMSSYFHRSLARTTS